jgi:hypothetical protein
MVRALVRKSSVSTKNGCTSITGGLYDDKSTILATLSIVILLLDNQSDARSRLLDFFIIGHTSIVRVITSTIVTKILIATE